MINKFKTILATMLFIAPLTSTIAKTETSIQKTDMKSTSIPATKIVFSGTGLKTKAGELIKGAAYGDMTTGNHGTFLKLPAGFISPNHTHTEDYFAVVIKGVVVNTQIETKTNNVKLGVGSYWFQRGKEKHITKCLSKFECLIFFVQADKFDFIPAQ